MEAEGNLLGDHWAPAPGNRCSPRQNDFVGLARQNEYVGQVYNGCNMWTFFLCNFWTVREGRHIF